MVFVSKASTHIHTDTNYVENFRLQKQHHAAHWLIERWNYEDKVRIYLSFSQYILIYLDTYKYIFWHMSMRVSVCLRTRGRRFDVRCVINLSSSFLFLFCFPNFCSTFISTLLGDCVGIYAFRVLSRSFWLFCSIKFVLKMWAKKSEKGKRTLN